MGRGGGGGGVSKQMKIHENKKQLIHFKNLKHQKNRMKEKRIRVGLVLFPTPPPKRLKHCRGSVLEIGRDRYS